MKAKHQKKRVAKQKPSAQLTDSPFMMILYMVKLNFTKLTPAEQIFKARKIVKCMTGNSHFPNPEPSLSDVSAAATRLEMAEKAMDGSKSKKIIRDARRDELEKIMGLLQDYVQFASKRNPEIIISSGMDIRDERTPVGILPAPEWVKVSQGLLSGVVMVKFQSVKKSSGYRIEYTDDPNKGWSVAAISEKASVKIENLIPGTRYYFRVATLSRAGWEGYSNTYTCRVQFID